MDSSRNQCLNPRLVGDPVDVLTGISSDSESDFTLEGPLPVRWRRFYDSGRNKTRLPLGWGHTHSYDHSLAYDMEGIAYTPPEGGSIHFPFLDKDGDEAETGNLRLTRLKDHGYRLENGGGPSLTFRFGDAGKPALLASQQLAAHRLAFNYRDGRLSTVIDSRDRVLQFTWTGSPEPAECRIDLLDPLGKMLGMLLTYRFDAAGNLTEAADHYNHRFGFAWDAMNRMIRKTDRRGYSFQFAYDRAGRCIRSAGEDGVEAVDLDYRPDEFRTTVVQADGGPWNYHFDHVGSLTHIVDPYGYAWVYKSDATGRIEEEIDPLGNAKRLVYDALGKPAGTVDALGRLSPPGGAPRALHRGPILLPAMAGLVPGAFVDRGALESRPYSLRTPIEWEFGGFYAYTHIRPPQTAELAGLALPSALIGMLATISKEQAEAYPKEELPPFSLGAKAYPPARPRRDILGTLSKLDFPDGSHSVWNRDANGNTLRYIDRDGRHRKYLYASWNHPAKAWLADGAEADLAFTKREKTASLSRGTRTRLAYEYDLRGRLIKARNGGSETTFLYDAADRLESKRDASGRILFTVRYGAADWIESLMLASGEKLSFKPDAEGRLDACESSAGKVEWAYGEFGRPCKDVRNGLGVEHEYDTLIWKSTKVLGRFRIQAEKIPSGIAIIDPAGGRHKILRMPHGLLLKEFANGAKELSQFDLAGRCLAKGSIAAGTFMPAWIRRYWYSSEGRLLEAQDSHRGTASFGYNEQGRLSKAVLASGFESFFQYDEDGNLTHQPGLRSAYFGEGNRILASDKEGFVHDPAGNVSERKSPDGTTVYHHDDLGRLIAADLPEGRWEAGYDALGRRAWTQWQGKRHEQYWDGERLAAEIFPDGKVRVYVFQDPSARIPLLFVDYASLDAEPASGAAYYPLGDQIGAPLAVMDRNWVAVWEAETSPYGRIHRRDATEFRYGPAFPGHYRDEETGLHYNRYRYYDPDLGRYLEPDPLDLIGGANLYAYTARPLDEVDLDGLACPKKDIITENINQQKRQEALELAKKLEERLKSTEWAPGRTEDENHTYAVTVVRKKNGEHEIWVTASHGGPPKEFIADLIPPGSFKNSPRRDRLAPNRENHAEQRALRAADCDPTVAGVETIAPTRPPCNCPHTGCSQQIQGRGDPEMDSVVQSPGKPRTGRELPPDPPRQPKPKKKK